MANQKTEANKTYMREYMRKYRTTENGKKRCENATKAMWKRRLLKELQEEANNSL